MSGTKEVEEEVLRNLDYFFNRGVAYLTLAHFYPNLCVHPVFPYPEYGAKYLNWRQALGKWDETKGLTPLGVKVVNRMLDLGMLIDVSHCTIAARRQIYTLVDSHNKSECVLATHVGAFELNRISYNLQDWELRWLADHGCAVGIIFMNYWLSPVDSGLGLKYIEQTLNHIINLGGEETPAIGTDFDGFTDPPDEIIDMSELPRITSYLKGVGYGDRAVQKFLGENALRVLTKGWSGSPLPLISEVPESVNSGNLLTNEEHA
jgi:membrane dipeptidase